MSPTGPHGQPRTRFEAIFQHAPDAIVVVAEDGRIVAANAQVEALFGHERDELIGTMVEALLPQRVRGVHRDHRRGFHEAPRVREMGADAQLFGLRKDGSEFPVEISLSPLPGDRGEVMAAIRDVTDRVAAEARIRAMMDFTPDATIIVGESGGIIFASRQVAVLFGYPPSELIGRNVDELLPARYRDTHLSHRRGFFGAPRVREMGADAELYGLRRDGSEFPVEISLSPLPGQPREVMAAIRDVTDRKAVESRSAAILEFAPDATIIVDDTGSILAANRQTTALFGHERDRLVGMTVEQLLPERFRWSHVTYRDSFFVSPRVREMGAGTELYGLRADGTEFAVEISLSPLPGEGTDVMATIRDVTERRAAREALEHALEQEREAFSQLRAASRMKDEFLDIVGHELRTPLTAISGFAHVLDSSWDTHGEDMKRGLVRRILRNAEGMGHMIERLLDMSRLQAGRVELALEEIDLTALVKETVATLGPLGDRPVEITIDVDETMVSDSSAITHILTNFLTNAAKFSPPDRPVDVRAHRDGDGVVLSVTDHGIGIPGDDIPHLFEHFFQGSNQAEGGRGVGVGLSVARRYTALLGGTIGAESVEGSGSTFHVWLPMRTEPHPEGDQDTTEDDAT